MLPGRRAIMGRANGRLRRFEISARWMVRASSRQLRRMLLVGLAQVLAAAQFLVPISITAAATGVVVAKSAAPAQASTGSLLILSTSVNGGASSQEAQDVPSGYTVQVATPSTWDAMTTAQFQKLFGDHHR